MASESVRDTPELETSDPGSDAPRSAASGSPGAAAAATNIAPTRTAGWRSPSSSPPGS